MTFRQIYNEIVNIIYNVTIILNKVFALTSRDNFAYIYVTLFHLQGLKHSEYCMISIFDHVMSKK